MRRRVLVRCVALILAGAGCVDPVEGPAPPVEVIPEFLSAVVERGIFVDVNGTYQGLTLLLDQEQPHLFYVNRELWEIRYAGCYARCDEERFWVRGAVDTTVFAVDYRAAGAAGLDATGTLHVLYGRRFYAHCRGLCSAASSWTGARIDTALTANLSLAVAPNGRLHALSIIPGLVYATCAGGCTDSANWVRATIAPTAAVMTLAQGTAITRDGADRLHVAFMTSDSGVTALRYGTCAAGCLDPLNWSFTSIDSGPSTFSFALANAGDTVHLVSSSYGAGPVQYATCAANCTSNDAWQRTSLGTLQGSSDASIAVGATGVRAVAVAGDGISVWRCAAGCGDARSWEAFRLDRLPDDSGFYRVEEVSIALDSAGQPLVARYGWGVVKYFRRNY